MKKKNKNIKIGDIARVFCEGRCLISEFGLRKSEMTIFEKKALFWLMKNTKIIKFVYDPITRFYVLSINGECTDMHFSKDELFEILLKNYEVK